MELDKDPFCFSYKIKELNKEKKLKKIKWITWRRCEPSFLELKFIQEVAETTTDGVSPPAAFDDRIKGMNSGRQTHSFLDSLFLEPLVSSCFLLLLLLHGVFLFFFVFLFKSKLNNDNKKSCNHLHFFVVVVVFNDNFKEILHENLTCYQD